ncbi:unnamed protein product [Peronospora destructor]|uniref:LysR substrate-binding domain-containing protein n=1 Tax=Peronospora destructor TaxID=86335 RepID=A0AAV0TSJ6_9STRA|nr:unnamed protein product [Peronospora destructor]
MKCTSVTFYRDGDGFVISGGNFLGEYMAKVLDYLAIGIHEITSVSERRIDRLVNPTLSNLPAFLVPEGGLNSGFSMRLLWSRRISRTIDAVLDLIRSGAICEVAAPFLTEWIVSSRARH